MKKNISAIIIISLFVLIIVMILIYKSYEDAFNEQKGIKIKNPKGWVLDTNIIEEFKKANTELENNVNYAEFYDLFWTYIFDLVETLPKKKLT